LDLQQREFTGRLGGCGEYSLINDLLLSIERGTRQRGTPSLPCVQIYTVVSLATEEDHRCAPPLRRGR
jgi:hypothetical protein